MDFGDGAAIDASGLPSCGKRLLEASDTLPAGGRCANAGVGTGVAQLEISSSQQPISVPLTLFNGGVKDGVTTLFIRSSTSVATSTPIVATVRMSKAHENGYGLQAVSTIPSMADEGAVLSFSLKIHRLFGFAGVKQSYAMASCHNGKLNAKIDATFSNGVGVSGDLSKPCTVAG